MKRLLTTITAALVASAYQVGLMSPTIIRAPKAWLVPAYKRDAR